MAFLPPFTMPLTPCEETHQKTPARAENTNTPGMETWLKLPHRAADMADGGAEQAAPPAVFCSYDCTCEFTYRCCELSLWDDLRRRTGGITLIDRTSRIDIPHSSYRRERFLPPTQVITVDYPVTSGVWSVGCYNVDDHETRRYNITVIVEPQGVGGEEEDAECQVYIFTGLLQDGWESPRYQFEVPPNTAKVTVTLWEGRLTSAGEEAFFVESLLKTKWSEARTFYGENATLQNFETIILKGPEILHIIAQGALTQDPEHGTVPALAFRDDTNPQTYTWITPKDLAGDWSWWTLSDKTLFVFLSVCYSMFNYGGDKNTFFGEVFANHMGAQFVVGHESVVFCLVVHAFVFFYYLILRDDQHDWSQVADAFSTAKTMTEGLFETLLDLGIGAGLFLASSVTAGATGVLAVIYWLATLADLLSPLAVPTIASLLFNVDGFRIYNKSTSNDEDTSDGGRTGGDTGDTPTLDPCPPSDSYGKPYYPPGGGTIIIYPL